MFWRKPTPAPPAPHDTHWKIVAVAQKGRTVTMTLKRNEETQTVEFYAAWGIDFTKLI